jgi:hypothetical protein
LFLVGTAFAQPYYTVHPGNKGDTLQVDAATVLQDDDSYLDITTFLKNITVDGGIRGTSLSTLKDSIFTFFDSSFFEESGDNLTLKDSSITGDKLSSFWTEIQSLSSSLSDSSVTSIKLSTATWNDIKQNDIVFETDEDQHRVWELENTFVDPYAGGVIGIYIIPGDDIGGFTVGERLTPVKGWNYIGNDDAVFEVAEVDENGSILAYNILDKGTGYYSDGDIDNLDNYLCLSRNELEDWEAGLTVTETDVDLDNIVTRVVGGIRNQTLFLGDKPDPSIGYQFSVVGTDSTDRFMRGQIYEEYTIKVPEGGTTEGWVTQKETELNVGGEFYVVSQEDKDLRILEDGTVNSVNGTGITFVNEGTFSSAKAGWTSTINYGTGGTAYSQQYDVSNYSMADAVGQMSRADVLRIKLSNSSNDWAGTPLMPAKISTVYGVSMNIENSGCETQPAQITTASGIYYFPRNYQYGEIGTHYGWRSLFTNNGMCGTNYGIHISKPTNTGTLTNNYGIYLGDQAVGSGSKYSIYSDGGQGYHKGDFEFANEVKSKSLVVSETIDLPDSSVTGDRMATAVWDEVKQIAADSSTEYSADESSLTLTGSTFGIKLGGITNNHIATGAAIAGTKINPDFGSQNVANTGYLTSAHSVTNPTGSYTHSQLSSSVNYTAANTNWSREARIIHSANVSAGLNLSVYPTALDVRLTKEGTGIVGGAYGVYSQICLESGRELTNTFSAFSASSYVPIAGTLGVYRGYYMQDLSITGTVGKIWGLYLADPDASHYLRGSTGINREPGSGWELDVEGDIRATGVISADSVAGALNGTNITDYTLTYAKIDTGSLGWVDARKFGFATGNNAAANTTAFNNALAYAQENHLALYLPSGSYNLNTIEIEGEYQETIKITGAGKYSTKLNFTDTGFRVNNTSTYLRGFELSDLGLYGAGVDTGIVLKTVNNPLIRNVHINSFYCGLYGNKIEGLLSENNLIDYNTINVKLYATSNGNTFLNTYTSQADSISFIFESTLGATIIGGEGGNSPVTFHLDEISLVTIKGGNYENPETYFCYIGTNSRLYIDTGNFHRGTASKLFAYLEDAGTLVLQTVNLLGYVSADTLFSVSHTDLVYEFSPRRNVYHLCFNRTNNSVYKAGVTDKRADNAIPTAVEGLRGDLTNIYRRNGGGAIDEILWTRALTDATYENVYLADNTKFYGSTSGAGHARNGKYRTYFGRKNVTCAAGNYTDVTVTIEPFSTVYSAIATSGFWQAAKEYRVQTYNYSTTGGTYTFRVWHPDDTGGGTTGNFSYQIIVLP